MRSAKVTTIFLAVIFLNALSVIAQSTTLVDLSEALELKIAPPSGAAGDGSSWTVNITNRYNSDLVAVEIVKSCPGHEMPGAMSFDAALGHTRALATNASRYFILDLGCTYRTVAAVFADGAKAGEDHALNQIKARRESALAVLEPIVKLAKTKLIIEPAVEHTAPDVTTIIQAIQAERAKILSGTGDAEISMAELETLEFVLEDTKRLEKLVGQSDLAESCKTYIEIGEDRQRILKIERYYNRRVYLKEPQ